MNRNATDIVIVGGGLAGAALALLLRQRRDVSVTMVEAASLPTEAASTQPLFTPSFDARSTALSAGTLSIFSELGLADALLPHSADIRVVHVSRRGRPGFSEICATEESIPRLGAVVENRLLGRVLINAVRADSGIDVVAPNKAIALTRKTHGYDVQLESGETLSCKLLVAADGAQSKTRDMLGVGAEHHDTGHAALIANIGLAQPHNGRAYERFVDDGPLAMLPMTDNRSALIWTGPVARIETLRAMPSADFLAAVQEQFGQRLGELASVGERTTYPLILTRTFAQALPHAVVVGNAAHTLHPVAGQGFNLTLRDLHLLADKVCASETLGELSSLQAYVDARISDQALISRVSHWLPKFFRIQTGAISHARQLGLIAFDLLPAVRSRFARKAMGFAGDQ